jgi:hypothetical protein
MSHPALNLTHDPQAHSWLASANGSDILVLILITS